ncbi:MAG: phosphatase PAP2 family protein [Bacteriovoracaceae bacterium]
MKYLFILTLFCSSMAHSWELKDFKAEIQTPITESKEFLGSGALILGTVLIFEDQIVDPTQEETVEDKPLGKWSWVGDLSGQMIPNGLYILGQSIAGSTGDKRGYERAIGMFKATAYAASVTTVLKYSIREPRPNNHKERNSFPSGHSTTVFAFAGYVFEEHGWEWGIPATTLAMFTAASRINDNRHYLHDVIAGATIGLSYGIGIARYQKKNQKLSFMAVPIYDGPTKGLAIVKDF